MESARQQLQAVPWSCSGMFIIFIGALQILIVTLNTQRNIRRLFFQKRKTFKIFALLGWGAGDTYM